MASNEGKQHGWLKFLIEKHIFPLQNIAKTYNCPYRNKSLPQQMFMWRYGPNRYGRDILEANICANYAYVCKALKIPQTELWHCALRFCNVMIKHAFYRSEQNRNFIETSIIQLIVYSWIRILERRIHIKQVACHFEHGKPVAWVCQSNRITRNFTIQYT